MFGYIIINKGDMKFKEFDIYHMVSTRNPRM